MLCTAASALEVSATASLMSAHGAVAFLLPGAPADFGRQQVRRLGIRRLDGIAGNESEVEAMGSAKLRVIAAWVVSQVRKSVTIGWAQQEDDGAGIEVLGEAHPAEARLSVQFAGGTIRTALAQAELLGAEWRRELSVFRTPAEGTQFTARGFVGGGGGS